MADIAKLTVNGSTYDIKDAGARELIAAINNWSYVVCSSAANTPEDVQWDSSGTTITGTLVASADTMYEIYLVPSTNGTNDAFDEYITVTPSSGTYKWEMFGNTDVHLSDLGDLAYKDNASATYTPEGTVSQPTFSGTQGSVSVTGTPAGTVSQPTFTGAEGNLSVSGTPEGTVSQPTAEVTPTTATIGQITAVGTLPSMTYDSTTETLTFAAGTLPTAADVTVMTGASVTVSQPTFSGSALTSTGTFTPSGTVSQPTFSGESLTSSGNFTPEGTVSQPTFAGTEATITVS